MKKIMSLLAGAVLLLCCGCAVLLVGAAAGAGATGVAYAKGQLNAHVEADFQQVAQAVEQAFGTLNIHKVSSEVSVGETKITGRTIEDTKVVVDARKDKAGGTLLTVRVGYFGNEEYSRRIYAEMQNNLPAAKK